MGVSPAASVHRACNEKGKSMTESSNEWWGFRVRGQQDDGKPLSRGEILLTAFLAALPLSAAWLAVVVILPDLNWPWLIVVPLSLPMVFLMAGVWIPGWVLQR